MLLRDGNYSQAYDYLVQMEKKRRCKVYVQIIITILIVFITLDSLCMTHLMISRKRSYENTIKLWKSEKYLEAIEQFKQSINYKKSKQNANLCMREYINKQIKTKEKIYMGRYKGKIIEWVYVGKEEGMSILLAQKALLVNCIHTDDSKKVKWEKTLLYKKLNDEMKKEWFDDIEQEFIEQDISLLSINEVVQYLPNIASRRCLMLKNSDEVLRNGKYVYWWIRDETKEVYSRMPFVTSEGVISKQGKSVMSSNIAVRPVIRVKSIYEKNKQIK